MKMYVIVFSVRRSTQYSAILNHYNVKMLIVFVVVIVFFVCM